MPTISSKGQTVIPQDIRERYSLENGSVLEWQPWGESTMLVRKKPDSKKEDWASWSASISGLHKEVWGDIDPVAYTQSGWNE